MSVFCFYLWAHSLSDGSMHRRTGALHAIAQVAWRCIERWIYPGDPVLALNLRAARPRTPQDCITSWASVSLQSINNAVAKHQVLPVYDYKNYNRVLLYLKQCSGYQRPVMIPIRSKCR